jgi:hypothetical protein
MYSYVSQPPRHGDLRTASKHGYSVRLHVDLRHSLLLAFLPRDIQVRTQPAALLRNAQHTTCRAGQRSERYTRIDIEKRAATARRPNSHINTVLFLETQSRWASQSGR